MASPFRTKSGRIAVAGVASALSVVILMLNILVPDATLAITATSAVVAFFIAVEFGLKLAVGVYAVSAVLSAIFVSAQPTVFWLYTLIFGLYSLIKILADKIQSKPLRVAVKIAFSAVTVVVYAVIATFVLANADMLELVNSHPLIPVAGFLLYELTFILYDVCLTRLARIYLLKWRRRLF